MFVADLKGTTLFHGAFPNLDGENRRSVEDANGKLFVVQFEKVVQSHGSGWVDYTFPKPGQSKPSQKWSYVKAVTIDGVLAYVGAGSIHRTLDPRALREPPSGSASRTQKRTDTKSH